MFSTTINEMKTENFIFHVMENRFASPNPGTCDVGDKLAPNIEEDHEGTSLSQYSHVVTAY